MDIENTKIPKQLLLEEFSFVKLKGRTKKPFENEWQKKRHSAQDILQHVSSGNNYGVMGGCGGLVIVDADTDLISELVQKNLPNTFTVKSGKGFHYYYLCQGIDKKIVLQNGDEHYGEIISNGSQVVGPGSVHPDTKRPYSVVNDVDIATIRKEEVLKAFEGYYGSSQDEAPRIISDHFEEIVLKYGHPFYLLMLRSKLHLL